MKKTGKEENCGICQKAFWVIPAREKDGRGKYCSKKCYWQSKKGSWVRGKNPRWGGGEIIKKCLVCGKQYSVIKSRSKVARFCSFNCYWRQLKGRSLPIEQRRKIGRRGQAHYHWKGGINKRKDGYVFVYSPLHPRANCNRVKRSVLVMEKGLGRFLIAGEIVHHVNRIRDDDRPSNLMLFKNESDHQKFHCKLKRMAVVK